MNTNLDFLKMMPLDVRCGYVMEQIEKAKKDNFGESNIDWEKVNNILFNDPIEHDYNLCSSVSTIEDIIELKENIQSRIVNGGPWHKKECKVCGRTVYLTKGEINYFVEKGLHVPKRCRACIRKAKEAMGI